MLHRSNLPGIVWARVVSRGAYRSDKVLTLMDIIATATLAFFGSLLAGGIVGWIVGRFCAFELALGIGLLIPGIVALTFATRCLLEYQHFRAPNVTTSVGEVVAVKDRPVNASGSITQPVFGTFPLSLGLWFIHSHISQRRNTRAQALELRGPARESANPTFAQRLRKELIVSFNLLLVAGIFWIGFGPDSLETNFSAGFGLVACAMLGHGIRGLFDPQTNASWCLGVFVLALNFPVWALALWLLF
ncbi:MAG TPA: hypothetical protein VGQ88_07385 [Burkholderiales bacterium]|nr:hypothetical protein [Burkholderiales bacterium]